MKKLIFKSVKLINVLFFLISSISFSQTVSSIVVDNSTLDENGGVAVIRTTISEASSKKATIPLALSGTPTIETDYTLALASKGTSTVAGGNIEPGSLNNELSKPFGIDVDASGNISITANETSVLEGSSIIMTATLDAAIEADSRIPLVISGTSTSGADFTTSFTSEGEESIVWGTENSSYNQIKAMQDGRQLVLAGSNLIVYNPSDDSKTTLSLGVSFSYLETSVNDIYVYSGTTIHKVDISDYSNVTTTEVLTLGTSQSFTYRISIEGDNILYNVYDGSISSNNRKIFKKEGSSDPEMIYQGSNSNYAPILLNDVAYQIGSNEIYKIIDGLYTDYQYLGNMYINREALTVFNGNIYAALDDRNDSSDFYVVKKLNISDGTTDSIPIEFTLAYQSIYKFAFTNNGNLLLYTYQQENTSEYSIFQYQLAPQLKVLAGETTGTITFTSVDDSTDEVDETIEVTPGTPTNGTLTDASVIILNIEDNDASAVVTFSLSAAVLLESNETTGVTLTATATPISAQEITIPFTLGGSAIGGYSVSAESITILAGSAAGSVTILGIDDTAVEVMETIVFTFGTLVNGSAEATDITLNLESDDNPTIDDISTDTSTISEDAGTAVITMTISEASSRDVTIPVTIAGTATANLDYTTSFASLGEENLVISTGTSGGQYSNFQILEDGKYVFKRYSSQLKVIDPEIGTVYTVNVTNSMSSIKTVGNTIYTQNSNNISAITIDSAGNITSEETLVTPITNQQLSGDWVVSGTTVYFQTYHNITGTRRVYSKQGNNEPILLEVANNYQYLFYNLDRLLAYNSGKFYEYKSSLGEFIQIGNGNGYLYGIKSINNKLYVKRILGEIYSISQVNVNSDNITLGSWVTDNITFGSPLQNVYGENINQMLDYSIDSSGNLLLYNQETEGEYGVYKYQQEPQLRVLAGETTGIITFTSVDDLIDEVNETIEVTPGTPTNATITDSSIIELIIEDNDDSAIVTFALSAATLVESNETAGVTLTATATPISEQEITIPFTLGGSAIGGYSVSAESITIPAGSATASVTILGVDDTAVEVMETIVFTFGILVNGSTEATDITLNLESDDNPTIDYISTATPTISEDAGTAVITMTISEASSRDVNIPVTIAGTATADLDYTTSFASIGEESLIKELSQTYNTFDVLEDGRSVFFNSNVLSIYNPVTGELSTTSLSRSYSYMQVSGNTIYTVSQNSDSSISGQSLYSIDVSDVSNILVTEEIILGDGINFEYEFSVEGDNILYNTHDSFNGGYKLYKREGNSTPELLLETTDWGLRSVLVNNTPYLIQYYDGVYEVVNGELVNQPQMLDSEGLGILQVDENWVNVYNGKVYARTLVNSSGGYQIYEINLSTGISTRIEYILGSEINIVKDFSFSPIGDLMLFNSTNDGNFGIYSYALNPQITVYAGDTEGTINFTIIDDESNEPLETIEVTPGTPKNATITDSSDVIIEIEDNDEGPAITFSLSPASIVEGSTTAAVLTAIPSIVSGQEIELTYTLSGSAYDSTNFGSDLAEFSVSSETLVIPANAESASIDITPEYNDTAVEPIETIVFDFTVPTNATFASGSTVTINLESDDDPVSALSATSDEVTEGESTELTITIDGPSSYDLIVPLELSGDAMFNIDYTTNFETEGRESEVMAPKSSNGEWYAFETLQDGRYVFLQGRKLQIYDPSNQLTWDYYMRDSDGNWMYFDYLQVIGNTIYLQDEVRISTLDASALLDPNESENNYLEPTLLLEQENANTQFAGQFFVEEEKILYQTSNMNVAFNQYKIYTKDGEADSVQLYEGNDYASMLFLYNDRVYRANGQTIYELYKGAYNNYIGYNYANSFVLMKSYNGIAYFLIQNNSNVREIHRINIESDIINGLNGNLGASTIVNYQLGDNINYVRNFTFDTAGNILLYNRTSPNNYWGVYNYQLSPQISIPAGEISGTFTFSATQDENYEPSEDIIITPGTPENGTLTSDIPFTVSILDDDTPPEVSFEFSNENIYEGSEVSVRLTATVDVQSGYEITIPFTMDGNANYNNPDSNIVDEYTIVDGATSIVIPPNSTTGSIEISTYENNDIEVEVVESIIFVFGEIQVGTEATVTAETPTMTLNLISEDLPTIDSSIIDGESSIAEGQSTLITVSLETPGSEDIYVPVSMSGTAEINIDYEVVSPSEGEESLLVDVTNNYSLYNKMGVLDDGRIVGLNNSQLTIKNPSLATENTAQLTQNYSYLMIDNNTIYLSTSTQMVQIDLTNISANIVDEEVILTTPVNQYFNYSPSVSNNTFVFNASSNQNENRYTYKKDGEADVQLIYTGTECCYQPIIFNDKIYQFEYSRVYELVDGEFTNQVNFNYGVDREKIKVINGQIIAMVNNNNGWQPHKIDPVTGQQTIYGNFLLGEDVVSIQDFAVESSGNLLLLNSLSSQQSNGSIVNTWGIYSYNFGAVIKIEAGSTSGSITINSLDDDNFEPTETISALVQKPSNALINENAELVITIIDNDEAPEVTFSLSQETIVEGSATDVTLTATLSDITPFEITIPFELYAAANPSSALEDEYAILDGATSIVIPANDESASISVSTNEPIINDTDVEIMETIVFTFGETQIGTEITAPATTESITLFLESDDDPVVTAISLSPTEFGEHEFTTIEATISEPASRDVLISLVLSGTATFDLDYSAGFVSEGEESLIGNLSSANFNKYSTLSDGRHVFLQSSSNLIIWDANLENSNTFELPTSYYYLQTEGNSIYVANNNIIGIVNINNNTADVEPLIQLQTNGLSMNGYEFSVENGNILYGVSTQSGTRQLWLYAAAGNESSLLYSGSQCCYKPLLVNGLAYRFENGSFHQIIDGEMSETYYFNGPGYPSKDNKWVVRNGIVYAMPYGNWNNSPSIIKFNMNDLSSLEEESVSPGDNGLVTEAVNIQTNDQITSLRSFDLDPLGNIVIWAESYINTGSVQNSLYSYQLTAALKVLAGQTSGYITLDGIEDDLNAPGEETDETIDISIIEASNATLEESITDLQATILNNEISFTLVGTSQFDVLAEEDNLFLGIPDILEASIEWGDYDRDGDQDFAIMGESLVYGRITRVYRNDVDENGARVFNQSPFFFNGVSTGQLKWVDYNKDGWIDLIVSGRNNEDVPTTTIFENQEGQNFVESIDLSLPNLYKTTMDSADFDNDGDIDFVINGQTAEGEWKKYIYYRDDLSLVLATNPSNNSDQFNETGIQGIIQIADIHNDGDQDIIGVGQAYSKVNTLIENENSNNNWNYWSWDNFEDVSMTVYGRNMYFMGKDNLDYKFKSVNLDGDGYASEFSNIQGLADGDIDVGDYNNDGYPDLLVVGDNSIFTPTTLLYDGSGESFTLNEEISFTGFRDATAKWIDYDNDGDLDLFLSGYGEDGTATHLYRNNLKNKSNQAPEVITNQTFEDLGNGRVRLSWDAPNDDFTEELGYVIRLGTTPGGTELSNTESNLITGDRLITKSPDIFTTSYELSLSPGNYYWSLQSVDGGQKGSVFSEEQSFQLTYEWKLLNQGGIIDNKITPLSEPIVRLTDIDADNDMDLVYGSAAGGSTNIYRLGDRRFDILSNGGLGSVQNITDIKFLDINNDLVQDILVSSFNQAGEQGFKLFNSTSDGSFGQVFTGLALANSKIRLIDINNDGIQEIIHIGDPNPEGLGVDLKVNVYEQSGGTLVGPLDISNQIESLKRGAFDFGDIDADGDIDFVITGIGPPLGSKVYLNETIYTETIAPIFTETSIENFGSVQPFSAYESTLDFIDFDNDGDIDIALTGSGLRGVMFKILINNGLSGSALAFTELLPTGLSKVRNAKLEFGDFNGDGYADVLYSGNMSGIGLSTKLAEYDPINQTYVDSDFDLEGIIKASVAFGDIDGDNDLDFVISGQITNENNNQDNIIKTYLNVRNESAIVQNSTNNLNKGKGKVKVEFIVNEKPAQPAGLTTEVLSYDNELETYKIKFKWEASTDDYTPQNGLTYALKVGTSIGDDDIMKINALPNGYRLSAGKGNVEHKKEWVLNLPNNDYFWSVQAIDAAFSGSQLSETKTINPAMSLSIKQYELLDVSVYPNPVNNDFVNIVSPLSETKQIHMYDIQGRIIISKNMTGNRLNISNVSNGVYLLKVIIGTKQKFVKLIIN